MTVEEWTGSGFRSRVVSEAGKTQYIDKMIRQLNQTIYDLDRQRMAFDLKVYYKNKDEMNDLARQNYLKVTWPSSAFITHLSFTMRRIAQGQADQKPYYYSWDATQRGEWLHGHLHIEPAEDPNVMVVTYRDEAHYDSPLKVHLANLNLQDSIPLATLQAFNPRKASDLGLPPI